MDYEKMKQRDMERRARRNAHKRAPQAQPTKFANIEEFARQQEREHIESSIAALREQLAYAKDAVATAESFHQMWRAEAAQRGKYYAWASGMEAHEKAKIGRLRRSIDAATVELRDYERKLDRMRQKYRDLH